MRNRLVKRRIFLAASTISLVPHVALADTWDAGGGASTSWSLPANWALDAVPASGADVVFATAGSSAVIDGTSRTVGLITFNLGTPFTLSASGGADLTINTGITTTGSPAAYAISAPINLGADNAWNIGAATTLDISGVVAGGFGITKTGDGRVILSNSNTYSGATIINGGTLEISTGTTTIVGGFAALGTSNPLNPDNLILNGGALRYTHTGSFGSSGAHDAGQIDRTFSIGTFGGTIDVSGNGPLNLYTASAIGLPGSGARTLTLTGTFVNNTDGTSHYDAIGGVLGDNGGPTTLVKDGSGEWVLTNANTYTGGTIINAGTLLLAHGDNRMWSGGSLTINAGGQLELFTGDSAFPLESITQEVTQLSGAGRIRLNSGTLWASNSTGMTSTFSGTIDDTDPDGNTTKETGGNIAKRGFGTLILSGSNNSYTGRTLVQAGVLEITTIADAGVNSSIGASTIANPAANLVIGSDFVSGTLRWVGATSQSSNRNFTLAAGGGGFDASGTGAASLTLSGAMTGPSGGSQTLTLSGSNTANNTLAGQIVNGTDGNVTSLAKAGSGKWVLTNTSNTYTGPTSISSGTLSLAVASTNNISASSSINVSAGAHLDVTGLTSGALSLSSGQSLGGNGTVWGNVTVNGSVSPGSSVGELTATGSVDLAPAGTYVWEISDADDTPGGAGVRWDHLEVQSLSISATTGSKFTIQVVGLPGTGGPDLDNFDPNISYTWVIATATGAITGFDADKFSIDLSLLTNNNTPTGPFRVFTSGGELRLQYVPEPGSALLTVVAAATLLRRNRRR